MRFLLSLLLCCLGTLGFAADSYRELFVKASATNASNINGGSSESRLFQRTNGNWNSTTKVFTATGDTLDSAWVGQLACVIADGGTTGAYFAEVTTIDNIAKTITLSSTRTLGTTPSTSATARTITIGGAWAGMSGATTFPFSISTWSSVTNANGDRIRINICGSYSVTSQISHTCPGIRVEGYSDTAGDNGLATLDYTGSSSVSTMSLAAGAGGTYEIRSLWFKNNSTAAVLSVSAGLYTTGDAGIGSFIVENCRFSDCVLYGLFFNSSTSVYTASVVGCEFFDCCNNALSTTGNCLRISGTNSAEIEDCIFHDNGANVVSCVSRSGSLCSLSGCIFDSNTVAIDDSNSWSPKNCVFYGNTTAFKTTPGNSRFGVHARGCIFENNTTAISRSNTTADKQAVFEQCAFYNNTTKLDSNATGRTFLVDCIDATTSTMIDPANGDFRTRSTLLRNRIDRSLLQSSGSYTKTTSRRGDIGIGLSNPFYRGQ